MLGLPLGWVVFFGSLNVNIPRYFLQHYLGLADQGIYASLAYLVVAINLVVAALGVSVTTRLARLFADRDHRQFVRLMTKLCMLGVLIVAVGVPLAFLVGRPLLTLLYRREYADHVGLLALFVAITGLTTTGNFLFCGLTAARSFRVQVPIYFAQMMIGVAGQRLLISQWGMMGRRCGATSLYVDNGVRRWVGVTPCCQGGVAREWLTLLCSSTCSLYVMASTCSLSQIEERAALQPGRMSAMGRLNLR